MSNRPVLEPTASHPITVEPTGKHVTVRVNGEVVADTDDALTLQEATYPAVQYIPLRDVVAATITRRLAETGTECVWLDATTIPRFATRFPTVHAACAAIGIDPAFGSGPLATIIQDVLTILLYFMVMTTLLA